VTLTRITVATRRPCEVLVGPGALAELVLPAGGAAALLCDANVERLHLSRLGRAAALPRLAVPPGEASKSFAWLERALEFMAEAGLDRRSTLVALGGGVVGDLGGLAAALFMRGIACLQCPTTLLAQVDAAIGGKTAVNLAAGKNLAGVFHQPARVLADTDTLATLPDEELRAGLGEVVKSALIDADGLLERLEREAGALRARDPERLAEIVTRCVRVKATIVARDEEERGERRLLNLGHTFAHGIERAAGYGVVPHGIAVAVGLVLALRASERAGLLEDGSLVARVTSLLGSLGLPADLAGLRRRHGVALAAREIRAGMRHDKKGAAEHPEFVLVVRPGTLVAGQTLAGAALDELLA
jgi:3-dehydroquinate synthase